MRNEREVVSSTKAEFPHHPTWGLRTFGLPAVLPERLMFRHLCFWESGQWAVLFWDGRETRQRRLPRSTLVDALTPAV